MATDSKRTAAKKPPELDLSLLPIFQIIFEQRSLTRAAKHLGLSQPALSRALGKLRRQLGDRLFERSGHELIATAHARRLADQLPQLLAGLRSAALKQPASGAAAGTLHIAADAAAQFWLSRRLYGQTDSACASRLQLHSLPEAAVRQSRLLAGRLDLALDTDADLTAGHSRLDSRPVFSEDYICAVRPGHPAALHSALSLQDYLMLEHLSCNFGGGRDPVDRALHRLKKRRKSPLQGIDPVLAADLTLSCDLCLTCPRSFASHRGLRCLPLPFVLEPWILHAHWHRDRATEPDLMQLLELLCKRQAAAGG